jgi:hypothetical protein
LKAWAIGNVVLTTKVSETPSPQNCCRDIDTKEMISLLCIVTGDESWFHHFEPETKLQSMEWHHLHSPKRKKERKKKKKKKAKTVPSAAKVMGTVFWDAEGCILAKFLVPGQSFNAAHYVDAAQALSCIVR